MHNAQGTNKPQHTLHIADRVHTAKSAPSDTLLVDTILFKYLAYLQLCMQGSPYGRLQTSRLRFDDGQAWRILNISSVEAKPEPAHGGAARSLVTPWV